MGDAAFDLTLTTQDITSELKEIERHVAEVECDQWYMGYGYVSGQRFRTYRTAGLGSIGPRRTYWGNLCIHPDKEIELHIR